MSNAFPRASGLAWLRYTAVWAFLFLVAWRTTQSTYAIRDLVALAALYALLAGGLVAAAQALATTGAPGRAAGALLVGLVLGWHLREQVRIEGAGATLWTVQGTIEFLPLVLVPALLFWILQRRAATTAGDTASPARRPLVWWAAATVAFFALLGATVYSSNTLRWHLLRHNRMVGSVAFLLFGRPVADIEAEDWDDHSRGAPLGQPEWVFELYEAGSATGGAGTDVAPTQPVAERRPDIVFVMLDTLRADSLAAFGGDPEWMPELNALTDETLLFTDVIANSSWTRPSVASFFTGLPQEEHGALSFLFRISSGALTLAELLASQGYETAAFVANSVIVDPASGYHRGFDTFEYVSNPPGEYARADVLTDRVAAFLAARRDGEAGAGDRGSGTGPGDPADATDASPREQAPLFLYVHYLDPHVPYMSTPSEGAEILPQSTDGIRRYYADELRFLDGQLARLMGTLDVELDPRRLTMVASDHGEEFGEHDGMGHSQTLYSEVIEIPVIVQDRTAGPAPSGRVDAPLEGRDFFDLLLQAAVNKHVDVPEWAASSARANRFASLSFTKNPGRFPFIHALIRPYRHRIFDRLIQRGDWRLIWSAFGETDELYDLSTDPGERRNVARAHPDVVRSLHDVLDVTPPYWVRPAPVDLSPERIEELRALGYIR